MRSVNENSDRNHSEPKNSGISDVNDNSEERRQEEFAFLLLSLQEKRFYTWFRTVRARLQRRILLAFLGGINFLLDRIY